MRIQVNGKHIDVGDSLREHAEAEITAAVAKHSDRPVEAIVTFSKDAHEHRADITVKLSEGLTAKATGRANEIYAACDVAVEKVEKQLRRYKRKLKHHRGEAAPAEIAPSYVLAAARDEDEHKEDLAPVVIAEMKTDLRSLSVGEAVMQMELEDAPFLMFRNDAHGGLNIVFRRDDGNIGWIDPANLAA